jgi:hypothetical protein
MPRCAAMVMLETSSAIRIIRQRQMFDRAGMGERHRRAMDDQWPKSCFYFPRTMGRQWPRLFGLMHVSVSYRPQVSPGVTGCQCHMVRSRPRQRCSNHWVSFCPHGGKGSYVIIPSTPVQRNKTNSVDSQLATPVKIGSLEHAIELMFSLTGWI